SLPGSVEVKEFSREPDEVVGRRVVWRLDSLRVGEVMRLAFVAVVDSPLVASPLRLLNVALVRAANDTTAGNDTSTVEVVAEEPQEVPLWCDVQLTKKADQDTVMVGATLSYRLVVTNFGPSPATECAVRDTLPVWVTPIRFVPAPDSLVGRVVVWRFPEIAVGEERAIEALVRVNGGAPEVPFWLVNSAVISALGDTNVVNDRQQAWTVVVPQPCEVWVSKAAEVDTVEVGSVFAYRLAVGNEGPGPAYRIAVVDTLPVHVAVTEFGMRPDSVEGRVVWWWIDSLGVGERREWAVWVRVDSLSSGQMRNVVVVNAAGDLVPGDDEAEKAVIVRPRPVRPVVCDVRMVKRADRDSVWAGGRIGYELEVSNLGPGVARQVVVVDSLPGSVEVKEFSREPDEVVGRRVVWRLDSLRVGEVMRLAFVAVVDSPLVASPLRLLNVALVRAANDTAAANNVDSTVVVAEQPIVAQRQTDLALTKMAGVETVGPGESFTCFLTVRNIGPVLSEPGWLVDLLPEHTVAADFSVTPDSLVGKRIVWRLPELDRGESHEVAMRLVVAAALPLDLTRLDNTAFVAVPNDSNAANDRASVTVQIRRVQPGGDRCDVDVQKVATRDTVVVEQTFWYQILVRNSGPAVARDVVLREFVPVGLRVRTFSPPPDSVSGNVAVWRIAALAPGEQVQVVLEAIVATPPEYYPAELLNMCTVSAQGDTMAENDVSRAKVVISEVASDCDAFYFDKNLFEPERGVPLTIFFGLQATAEVALDLYDITGYHVTRIVKGTYGPGVNSYVWEGTTQSGEKVGSGVYVIALRTGGLICWKKVILLR
ncbi:MAG: hypothetical protein ONB25_04285, partial [candidate division KSB1 bacterium]|nr:hypothetical protein [candidate division KSB1 bacterium]